MVGLIHDARYDYNRDTGMIVYRYRIEIEHMLEYSCKMLIVQIYNATQISNRYIIKV